VCEERFKRKAKAEHQFLCGRRKCQNEHAQWPQVYLPFGTPGKPNVSRCHPPICKRKSARKTGLKLPHALRLWKWQKSLGEDQDYELHDAAGEPVARIRQEGGQWWVARPRCFPEPPLEELDGARARAISLALMTLPNPLADRNRGLARAVQRERELYPRSFSDAGERYVRGELGGSGPQWEPSASSEMPDLPDFLKRTGAALVEAA
jgi:hypothetical protein